MLVAATARSSRRPATPRCCCTSTRGRRRRRSKQALIESVSQAQGAFSLVLLTKDRLIAVRDPHGFRPLTLGRLGDAYIVCSETCALDLIDADVGARHRAGRGARHRTGRRAVDSAVSRRRRRRTASSSTSTSRGPTPTCSARASTKCARSSAAGSPREQPAPADVVVPMPDSGVCAATGFAEAVRPAAADGPHPQSLRRPDVHRAASVDSALRRARQAQSGEEHSAGQARRARRRLDRARHDEPQDREDGARGGRDAKCTCGSAVRRRSRRASTASIRRSARS